MASVENSAQPNGTNGTHADSDQTTFSTQSSTAPSNASAPQADNISKDEVGWYFVEQYYTTLSRTPERLYLFYNKRSQFVSGQETDKVEVCVGQRAISEKIQELDFQDCKVRVTNVDSQASDSNIVIQVIGEMCNKSQPHKKFTQTFVLATQPKGYFVLNDIFRYLAEDDEEAESEAPNHIDEASAAPSKVEPEPKTLADPAATEKVVKSLEEKIEKPKSEETSAAPVTNGVSSDKEETSTAAADTKSDVASVAAVESEEPKIEAEEPKEPEPTRVATPVASTAQPAATPAPAAPAVPKTWATLAAAANSKVATPGTPAAPSSTAAPKQAKAPSTTSAPTAPAATTPNAPAAAAPASAAATAAPAKEAQDDEWTAVGGSHNRQVSRQANAPPVEIPANRGYIKSVFDHVTHEDLKAALEKFGELTHFDIARAPRNAAFVDFKTAEGFNKALNTPLEVNGEKLYVEERKPHRGGAPYPRGQFQGRGGRGGPNGAPRGGNNFAPNNRGGFTPRGRGGPSVARGGRGQAQ